MKAYKLASMATAVAALAGCEYFGFGSGFDYAQVDDKIEGTKLVAHKQFINEAKTLIADAKFSCNTSKKALSFELGSFNQPEKKSDEKLTGAAFILDNEELPEGKIKLGANDAIDFSSLLGLSMSSFSNVVQWNIPLARAITDWANTVSERNKTLKEIDSIKSSNPMLSDFSKKSKTLEENKAKFDKYEKEQLALSEKTSEDFEKQNYLNKIKLFKEDLNIESDEKSLIEFKEKNSQDVAKYAELQNKFNQLQAKAEETFKKVVENNPESSKAMKEAKNLAQSGNPFAAMGAALGMMGGTVIAEASLMQMPVERKKIIELGTGSTSDGDFLKKLGNVIALQYKAKNGEITFSIDLADKNLQKVITACQ